ncbi:L-2,3-butanediol dehydrogenase [Mycena sanguinolenta]|uniref:L-2,3-butanediol dehydrogenase n=1 Tax=Mycena sanguinolenta TaxID=230812 RepID=A0A8H6ZHD3_9AGAR|nr:L-2,3-butanediol dehydrogenase [Mycena sanguinolenta]
MAPKGVAFVTGAAQGLGKAIALRLADDGFDVAVNDLPTSSDKLLEVVEEIKAKGRASSSHLADISIEEEVQSMFAKVVRVHGGLDVMVANAGTIKWSSLCDMSVDDWDRIMAVNCRGTFLCYKYAGLQMIEQGRGGRIIGATSAAGKRVGSPFMSAYSVSKFAIHGLTQSAALEYGPHGITVNCYAPGAINTGMIQYLDDSSAQAIGAEPGTFLEFTKNWGVLGTTGTPEDVSSLVSFIASEESRFITGDSLDLALQVLPIELTIVGTGQSLSVNGGMLFD